MKNSIRIFVLLISTSFYAQVGIGTTSPETDAILDLTATSKALLLPRVANTAAITSPINGMMIYDISAKCIKGFENGVWSSCFSAIAGSISTIDCDGATNSGTLTSGTLASGVSSSISYTDGNGGSHNGQIVTSTDVTGLTATLSAGSFATGAGSLTYTITGTPDSSGTASFAINIGGQTCTLTRTVNMAFTVPTTITIAQNKTYLIASVYDEDYLPYTSPTVPATTNTLAADGLNEATTINIQGTISTIGVSIEIPVTTTGSGTLPAYSTTISIPDNLTEDGFGRDLTLSWASQSYTLSTTTITATIVAVGGDLNAKKLDINAGIGNDALGVLMGTFSYPYDNAGNTTNYQVRTIAGIPDKKFGLPDNNGDSTTHMMLYLPTVAEDGNIWLNNNLGANYANINNANFNPAQQATSTTDYLAFGSLFQWGRKGDGHELINWTSGTSGTAVNGDTNVPEDDPTHALFIRSSSPPFDWNITQDNTRWATEASVNNPCPIGFRVPTESEQITLISNANITEIASAFNSALKFTLPGRRLQNSSVDVNGISSYYWNSTVTNDFVNELNIGPNFVNTQVSYRVLGQTVRCIKD